MEIALYSNNSIFNYKLPKEVSGSFSFDPEDNESKLINIRAVDGKWILYGTTDIEVVYNGKIVPQIEIVPDSFYLLKKNDIYHLIYIRELKINNTMIYSYDSNFNLLIGNNEQFNIKYDCLYLNDCAVKVAMNNNSIIAETQGKLFFYLNKERVNGNKVNVSFGDEIEVYGLRIIFLKNYILINNIQNKLFINESKCNIKRQVLADPLILQNSEIKDVDLYTPDDYYSKAPRMRRGIQTKVFRIISPPSTGEGKKMPAILTLGPSFTMAIISVVTFTNTITRVLTKKVSMADSWPSLVTSSVMLISSLVWPNLTRMYNKKMAEKQKKEMLEKYDKYLKQKEVDLINETNSQKVILNENLLSIEQCINLIKNRGIGFWDKRIEQNDFLVARVGIGTKKLDAEINYDTEEFSIEENELKKRIAELAERYKNMDNVPIGYSFYENKTTAIMGLSDRAIPFVYGILIQLIAFYSYEDLKIVLFTNKKNKSKWEFLKYLNHNFNNDRTFRYFASDSESSKAVAEVLGYEMNRRLSFDRNVISKPQYFVIVDGYDNVKRYDFIKQISEIDGNLGFNMVILENKFNKLPSKCNSFIMLSDKRSEILQNSYENQERTIFSAEYGNNLNMSSISKLLSNIPIEFEDDFKQLPNAIDFLEMEKVCKVEQLNILNRWNSNNSSDSLKAEVGVDEQGDLMYLDLHEKFHGPHGLIAGMTGSGKSEFIITYVLSMAINYSPDDVAFILIDYKGGGLAFAFENVTQGIVLPHLAGTITNLDKAEMDRTLVSINSELQRRQKIFNEVRDKCGESTIDIYKYQRLFKDGRTDISIPHLFIVCDEFAELKSQQPEFMDNLISVARIGRSLGIHLILATQKPTGVVSDQIWSNSKFRVCLKVQDESDSKEMLKKPDAASLKQTGRFYLQVGYDEYFALGQSGWCGAKYYPTDKIIKKVDKSINFINDFGNHIKSIQASTQMKVKAEGDQLSAILNSIIGVSKEVNKKARKLWLDNIPEIILEHDLENKYNVISNPYNLEAVIGEYDAPEKQEQGLVKYNYIEDGNTIIYGNDGSENEMLLNSIIYSTTKHHSSDEINYYIIDYGSESFRRFTKLPHVGGLVFAGDSEKFRNLLKLIKEEISSRKKLFVDYNGEFKFYNRVSETKIPLITIIINNYDSLYEEYPSLYEELPEIVRDSERYGIVFIFTCNSSNSIHSKITQNCSNIYALKMKDTSDYSTVFNGLKVNMPRDVFGRGLINNDGAHEFQVATITTENLNDYLKEFVNQQRENNKTLAKAIPMLPDYVNYDVVKDYIDGLNNIPIGINKADLTMNLYNFTANPGTIVSANKIEFTEKFIKSLLQMFLSMKITTMVFDSSKLLKLNTSEYPNYYVTDIEDIVDKLNIHIQALIDEKKTQKEVIVIYGIDKFVKSMTDVSKLTEFTKLIKKYENISLIIVDAASKMKNFAFESWYTSVFNNSDGIWIGRGISDQNILRLSSITKEMTRDMKPEMGFVVNDNYASLCKYIDFITSDGDKDEE